ncbi:hypothetical protein [Mycobacterium haemophilum]
MLSALAVAQAIELHAQGWRMAMGTLPEWMSGFGTLFTAIAAVAAFRALRIATRDWEGAEKERQALEAERRKADKERRELAAIREAERQDHLVSQARSVIVEPFVLMDDDGKPNPNRHIVIRNHSNSAILNLHVDPRSPKNSIVTMEQFISGSGINRQYRTKVADLPVLGPGEATPVIYPCGGGIPWDESATEYVGFSFTDVRGARWYRLGSEQPVQILGADSDHPATGDPKATG